VNTSVYALILFVIVYFWLYPLLKKQDIKFSYGFALALLPFIVFGSALRVLNDMGILHKTCNILDPGFFTFTPGIWFLTAGITIAALLIAKKIAKADESKFAKIFGGIGLVISLPIVLYEFSIFRAWEGFFIVIGMVIAITLVVKIIVELKEKKFFSDKLNILVVAGQVLDGSATFVATNIYTCGEQHPLSDAILGVNPGLFILVKIALALLIIHYIDQDVKDKNFANFVKIAVIILGFATGGRDLLTLGAGTCL